MVAQSHLPICGSIMGKSLAAKNLPISPNRTANWRVVSRRQAPSVRLEGEVNVWEAGGRGKQKEEGLGCFGLGTHIRARETCSRLVRVGRHALIPAEAFPPRRILIFFLILRILIAATVFGDATRSCRDLEIPLVGSLP